MFITIGIIGIEILYQDLKLGFDGFDWDIEGNDDFKSI
jgi:hypothetical protein